MLSLYDPDGMVHQRRRRFYHRPPKAVPSVALRQKIMDLLSGQEVQSLRFVPGAILIDMRGVLLRLPVSPLLELDLGDQLPRDVLPFQS